MNILIENDLLKFASLYSNLFVNENYCSYTS